MGETIRINRFLASAGLGSRRKVEALVLDGRVTINGQPVRDLAARVDPERDRVRVGARVVQTARRVVYILFHKPVNVLTTAFDPEGRRTVFDFLKGAPHPLFPVGRLDRMSEGLLLLTNDGPLAHRLAHPRYKIRRVYRLRIAGVLDDDAIRRFGRGTRISGHPVRPEEVNLIHRGKKSTTLEVVLLEGRNREIRRICEAMNIHVERLLRIRLGPLSLKGMAAGEWRYLTESEVDRLRLAVRLGTA